MGNEKQEFRNVQERRETYGKLSPIYQTYTPTVILKAYLQRKGYQFLNLEHSYWLS